MRQILLVTIITLTSVFLYGNGFNSDAVICAEDSLYRTETSFAINSHNPGDTAPLISVSQLIDSLARQERLVEVNVVGSASPDGRESYNDRLALARAEKVTDFLLENCQNIPDTLFSIIGIGENWKMFEAIVQNNTEIIGREDILNIIRSTESNDAKEAELRVLNGGAVWQNLLNAIFPALRVSLIMVKYDHDRVLTFTSTELAEPETVSNEEMEEEPTSIIEEESCITVKSINENDREGVSDTNRYLYLKSNLPVWGMLLMNAAVELDFAPHWSGMIPVYYSGFNYFTLTRKYRAFASLPEARWWPRSDNSGWFFGAHAGFIFFNYAAEGEYRYQDHRGRRPAFGGGLSTGYRFDISRNGHWHLELSIGAGIYDVKYDRFQNRYNGLLIDTHHRTIIGIDNAAVTLSYRFDLKGGGR